MIIDFKQIQKQLKGRFVPKPLSGTLSGHAAGEPFDKHCYLVIKKQYPKNTFRQYEYLNFLYSKNLSAIGYKEREQLFNSPTVMFLLNRGKNAIDKWSIENPFDEKQNDTADILVVKDGFYEIIDIKTRNISKSAQAPNIISAYKLALLCAKMIDNNDFNTFNLNYIEIDWLLKNEKLVCQDTHYINLFKSDPQYLYINWSAAMQIQFHICDLNQNYKKSKKQWAKDYIKHFVLQAKKRSNDMILKFVKPFEKYIDKK